jgi:hypothetical protein
LSVLQACEDPLGKVRRNGHVAQRGRNLAIELTNAFELLAQGGILGEACAQGGQFGQVKVVAARPAGIQLFPRDSVVCHAGYAFAGWEEVEAVRQAFPRGQMARGGEASLSRRRKCALARESRLITVPIGIPSCAAMAWYDKSSK